MSDPATDMPRWHVVLTHPKQEFRAEGNLKVNEVETFLPRIKARHPNPFINVQSFVVKPLFPRYLFARFKAETALRKVCFTRGVHGVLNFGGGPAVIGDEIISLLQSRVGDDGYVKFDDELTRGDKVMIEGGPLKTLVGVFQHDLKGSERVVILLTAISYQGHIVIEKDLVRKIG